MEQVSSIICFGDSELSKMVLLLIMELLCTRQVLYCSIKKFAKAWE
jgi:hypothetical protein